MKNLPILLILLIISGCSIRSKYCPKLANEIQEMIKENNDIKKTYKKLSSNPTSLIVPLDDYIHSESIKALTYYYIDLCEFNINGNL